MCWGMMGMRMSSFRAGLGEVHDCFFQRRALGRPAGSRVVSVHYSCQSGQGQGICTPVRCIFSTRHLGLTLLGRAGSLTALHRLHGWFDLRIRSAVPRLCAAPRSCAEVAVSRPVHKEVLDCIVATRQRSC